MRYLCRERESNIHMQIYLYIYIFQLNKVQLILGTPKSEQSVYGTDANLDLVLERGWRGSTPPLLDHVIQPHRCTPVG